ncbi:hypothetical protein Cadr_000003137 [Camelus dromedarius]|uniref:Uncharacterized protein n=1 Tax=Camelus dromedarius TaxID=9838 RepID=A0A5N4C2T1_CAMDR|nr:hypothetical protein Cadr_000003137 [Camelus dromedarius]
MCHPAEKHQPAPPYFFELGEVRVRVVGCGGESR